MTELTDKVKAFVSRLDAENEAIKIHNENKTDIFAEVKASGLSVKALKLVMQRRAKDPIELSELDSVVEIYEEALTDSDQSGTRARADAREAA